MSKAVLISIRPEWVKKILAGEKTLEVRKNRPNMETPFKVYIYCTAGNLSYEVNNGMMCNISGGKLVAGEFVCDTIFPIQVECSSPVALGAGIEFPGTCLTDRQILEYLGNGKQGYAWHISGLKVYDVPLELTAFRKPELPTGLRYEEDAIKRPPQSWYYVEELQ